MHAIVATSSVTRRGVTSPSTRVRKERVERLEGFSIGNASKGSRKVLARPRLATAHSTKARAPQSRTWIGGVLGTITQTTKVAGRVLHWLTPLLAVSAAARGLQPAIPAQSFGPHLASGVPLGNASLAEWEQSLTNVPMVILGQPVAPPGGVKVLVDGLPPQVAWCAGLWNAQEKPKVSQRHHEAMCLITEALKAAQQLCVSDSRNYMTCLESLKRLPDVVLLGVELPTPVGGQLSRANWALYKRSGLYEEALQRSVGLLEEWVPDRQRTSVAEIMKQVTGAHADAWERHARAELQLQGDLRIEIADRQYTRDPLSVDKRQWTKFKRRMGRTPDNISELSSQRLQQAATRLMNRIAT